MKVKPFVNVSFCYACKCPVPRIGLFLRTSVGNASISSSFYCPKCAAKRKEFQQNLKNKSR